MGIKAALSRPLAAYTVHRYRQWQRNPVAAQQHLLGELVRKAASTAFGRAHDLAAVRTPADLASRVPIRDYEALKPYFDRVKVGEADVLWPGRPLYLAKTSGTTSGAKYIPITQASISNHINWSGWAAFPRAGSQVSLTTTCQATCAVISCRATPLIA
jgi:non-ribosomal peptide synthetase component F